MAKSDVRPSLAVDLVRVASAQWKSMTDEEKIVRVFLHCAFLERLIHKLAYLAFSCGIPTRIAGVAAIEKATGKESLR